MDPLNRDQSLISEFTEEGLTHDDNDDGDVDVDEDGFFTSSGPFEEKKDQNDDFSDEDGMVGHEVWPEEHELVLEDKENLKDVTEENSEDASNEVEEKLFSPNNCLPAFKCVMFCPARYRGHPGSSRNRSNRRFSMQSNGSHCGDSMSETATASSETNNQNSGLGLDLLIEEQEREGEETEEVWIINNVKLKSVLVDSPLEHGDVLVSVNGNMEIQQGLDAALANRHEVLTLVVHNPDPQAQHDLVETWVHPSAYQNHDDDGTSIHSSPSRSISSSATAPDFLGLHFKRSSSTPYLKVDRITAASPDGEQDSSRHNFWEHTLLGSEDLVLSVDRLPVAETSERTVARALHHDQSSSSPITLHTQLRSTEGLALAAAITQQQSKNVPMNHPSRGKLSTSRTRLGLVVGAVALVAIILLILVAINHKQDTDKNSNSDAAAQNDATDEDDPRCGDGCVPSHLRHRLLS